MGSEALRVYAQMSKARLLMWVAGSFSKQQRSLLPALGTGLANSSATSIPDDVGTTKANTGQFTSTQDGWSKGGFIVGRGRRRGCGLPPIGARSCDRGHVRRGHPRSHAGDDGGGRDIGGGVCAAGATPACTCQGSQ